VRGDAARPEIRLNESRTATGRNRREAVAESKRRKSMEKRERDERERLHLLWMEGKATKKQMLRCMELDRQAEAEFRKEKQDEKPLA
jgi:hypothetical protein